jgi:hypothetical protein
MRSIAYSYCSISGEPCRHHSNDQILYIKPCSDIHSKKELFKKIWSDAVEFCNNISKPIGEMHGYCPAKMALAYRDYGMMKPGGIKKPRKKTNPRRKIKAVKHK